jgi:Fic family protein
MFEDALKVSGGFIEKPIGAYRTDERYIKGVDVKLSSPLKISQHIDNLLYRFNAAMSIEEIAQFHIEFEQIHPFADGNGRIGRLLMALQFIQNDGIPPLILNDNRREYLDVLVDSNKLAEFLLIAQNESLKLIDVA